MTSRVAGPTVELTVRVRFPLPEFEPGYAEFGIHSVEDLLADHLDAMRRDPSFLADLIASDRSETEYEFDLGAVELPDDYGAPLLGAWDDEL